jgi:hypothetical protein
MKRVLKMMGKEEPRFSLPLVQGYSLCAPTSVRAIVQLLIVVIITIVIIVPCSGSG